MTAPLDIPTHTRSISLRTGGKITLVGEFDYFDLKAEERELVKQIIDLMASYERNVAAISTGDAE